MILRITGNYSVAIERKEIQKIREEFDALPKEIKLKSLKDQEFKILNECQTACSIAESITDELKTQLYQQIYKNMF